MRVGDWIGLCYHGIRTSAQGRGYYLWSLVVSEERRRELEEQDRSEPEADEELIEVDLRAELESL
ncbi:hypothetical protein GWO18_00460, partial [Candidatus Bathyarchaeota archaeon]|nr:hypothetical protein [Candidatus Bathyarchaeota archaeon]